MENVQSIKFYCIIK